GVMRWTAPSGRGYDTHPRSRVFFREAEHTTPPGDDAGAGRHDPNPNQSQNPNSSPDPVGQPGAAPSGVVWSDLDLPGAVWSEFDTSEFDTSEFEWPEPAAFDLVPPESGPIDPDDCFYTPDPEGDAANPDPDPYPEFPVLTTV
uniref:hypothetical protein n=1 Tax=Microbacterium indicum TaxID=358100 RepID=UPI001B7F8CEB